MLTDRQEREIIRNIVDHFGIDSQLGMVNEECAELIQAVNKFNRATSSADKLRARNSIRGEMADVQIMIDQLKEIFSITEKEFRQEKDYKLLRMKRRIDETD